jgi:hypothetical protein
MNKEKDSSFSEEKEAKRLLEALRGWCHAFGWEREPPLNKSLFASFSSEKEDPSFLC